MDYLSWLEPHREGRWVNVYVNEEDRFNIDVAPASCFLNDVGNEYSAWSVYAVCRQYRPLGLSTIFSCVKISEPAVDIISVVVRRTEANGGSACKPVKWNKKTMGYYVPIVRTDDPGCQSMSKSIVEIASRNDRSLTPAYLHEVLEYVNKPRKKIFGIF